MTFEQLKLRPELVKACRRQGFKEATPIQALVIPVIAAGRDALVESKTGSGKTLAYGLPLLDREPLQAEFPEALVVAPTRELAQQIDAELTRTAKGLSRRVVTLTGGGGMDRQRAELAEGATVVVGTAGRLLELLERKFLRLDHLRTVVFDEVDELLKGGFGSEVAALLAQVPTQRQTLLFSATIPTEVDALAKQFTRDAARLKLSVARELPTELSHRVLFTSVDERLGALVGFLKAEKPFQALVFCGTRNEAEEVNAAISELGLQTAFLHGELSPLKRRQLLDTFRSGDLPVLVATDLAARGLDLPGVDLVVNYSLPKGSAAYLHRAGRTGRAGRPGTALSLVIEQQHGEFEKLKGTFPFQGVDVLRGRVVTRELKTREERDRLYAKLPELPPKPLPKPKAEPERFEPRSGKGTAKGRAPFGKGAPPAGKAAGKGGRKEQRPEQRTDQRKAHGKGGRAEWPEKRGDSRPAGKPPPRRGTGATSRTPTTSTGSPRRGAGGPSSGKRR